MPHEPFPGRGEDSKEPSGSALPPALGAVPQDDWDTEAARDCELLPEWLAEDEPLPLTVFSDEGLADEMGPGPVLASLVHAAIQDPAALDEDQLVGVIAAVRRIESRMAWTAMTAMRLRGRRPPPEDLRRPRRRPDPPGPRPDHRRRDEVPVRPGRRPRRRDPRRGGQDQVLWRAPLRRPPPGPEARPVLRRPPQGSRPPQRRGPPVPRGIR
jgi:hypothetical protein